MIGMVGLRLSLVVGSIVGLLVLSLIKINCIVVIAVASSHLLFKTEDMIGGNFRTDNRSDMIIDNVSMVVIVRSAYVMWGKSTVLDV